MYTTSRMDMLENLQRAAGFDANRIYSSLCQHLGYRKLLAEQILRGGNIENTKELEELYERVNTEIKLIIGL